MKENELLKYYPIHSIANKGVFGRTNMEYPDGIPMFYNGSCIELNVKASELWIELSVGCDVYEPWCAVKLNDAVMSRQMLLAGSYKICLFRSMNPDDVKNVKFIRELQAMSDDESNFLLVKGFWCDGEFMSVSERSHRIEFIGDSITSGEGTYGAVRDVDWLSMYMSYTKTYMEIIERRFNADVRLMSQGGWGVYVGWDNDLRHNIPSVYDDVCRLACGEMNIRMGARNAYDFSSWEPEVIIINLGTNDTSAFRQPPFTDPETGALWKMESNEDGSFVRSELDKIIRAIVDFLRKLRLVHASSRIVWTFGILGSELEEIILEAISDYKKQSGDDNVDYLPIPNTTEETLGAHFHPGYEAHKIAAKVIGDYLEQLFNS